MARPPIRRILFLASNPTNTLRLRLDKEAREIEEGLKRSAHRDHFEFVQKTAVKVEDLRRCLLEGNPNIVQIAGHGEGEDGIKVENDQGKAHLVPTDALAGLFQLCAVHVECVIMTSCYSEVQADAIAKYIPFVIGMKQGIGDAAAIEFSIGFYDALGAGKSIKEAFAFGCNAIALRSIPEEFIPVLKSKDLTSEFSFAGPATALLSQRPTIRENSAGEILANLEGMSTLKCSEIAADLYVGRWTREPGWQATVSEAPSQLPGGGWVCTFKEVGSGTLIMAITAEDISTRRRGDVVTVSGKITEVWKSLPIRLADAIIRDENV